MSFLFSFFSIFYYNNGSQNCNLDQGKFCQTVEFCLYSFLTLQYFILFLCFIIDWSCWFGRPLVETADLCRFNLSWTSANTVVNPLTYVSLLINGILYIVCYILRKLLHYFCSFWIFNENQLTFFSFLFKLLLHILNIIPLL